MENRHSRRHDGRDSGDGSGRDSGSDPNKSTGPSSPPSKRMNSDVNTERIFTDSDSIILFVSDVNSDATLKDIRKFLKRGGRFKWFCIFYDSKGKFTGEAEVAYQQISDAEKAIAELNGKYLKGDPVTIGLKLFFRKSHAEPDNPSDFGSVPDTCKDKGKKRKKSSDEEEDDSNTDKTTKQPRGIKIG